MSKASDDSKQQTDVMKTSIANHLASGGVHVAEKARTDPEKLISELQERFAIDREEARRQLEGWLATTDMNAG